VLTEIDAAFEATDTDHDHKVSLKEYMTAVELAKYLRFRIKQSLVRAILIKAVLPNVVSGYSYPLWARRATGTQSVVQDPHSANKDFVPQWRTASFGVKPKLGGYKTQALTPSRVEAALHELMHYREPDLIYLSHRKLVRLPCSQNRYLVYAVDICRNRRTQAVRSSPR
jgi:hypothetical protein